MQRRAPAPSPLLSLPRGFFNQPRERRASNAPPPAVEEVPSWLFAGGDITEDQAAHIAAAIDGALSPRSFSAQMTVSVSATPPRRRLAYGRLCLASAKALAKPAILATCPNWVMP